MSSLVTAANRIMSTVAVSALVFMFCLIFGNVVLRFGFSTGISFAEELARYAFLWCTFIGAVLALGQNAHIGITGIRPRLPRRALWALWAFDAVVILIQLVVTAIVLVGSVGILVANVGGQAPVSGTPVTIAFAALVTGALAILLVFGGRLWRTVRRREPR